jgi:putative transcriptional regulator
MERIAGDIVLSKSPARTIRKWRDTFKVSQNELASVVGVNQSVISDYESGRRKSPGVATVRKLVQGLVTIDERRGGQKLRELGLPDQPDGVLAVEEFRHGVSSSIFLKMIDGRNLTPRVSLLRDVYGYTIIDSVVAITSLDFQDYYKIYGPTSARALMFTGVKYGRSPMIAIRLHPLKPAMVVYIQPEKVDPLAQRLAEIDNVCLVQTSLKPKDITERLESL